MAHRSSRAWRGGLSTAALGALTIGACAVPPAGKPPPPASILLVTLDTTRADAIGPGARGVHTPAFNALTSRGRSFRQAYATVPETLPSHASMMTGLYPAGHGIHENARPLGPGHPVLAERLKQSGYRTAAFVSSFVLARRFGIARGFDVYDDEQPAGRSERSALETTDRAVAYLEGTGSDALFLWVHYFDPHYPYAPPDPFRAQYATHPYLGEVAAMDAQLGRLVQAFEQRRQGTAAIVVAADHGEGLGDHGEQQHGSLLYQSTMHVPLVVVGPGVSAAAIDRPVSTRRIFDTVLDFAGLGVVGSLKGNGEEIVLGEAMKPFLEYGWQPQVMTVAGRLKAILAGTTEVYDLAADPAEARNLGSGASLPAAARTALDDYPVPSAASAPAPDTLDEEARRRLASLGYVGASSAPVVRRDAPRPADMTHLFAAMEKASGLFVNGQYAQAIPLLERILADDRFNLDAALRLATAHSALGNDAAAVAAFRKAAAIAPRSQDVRTYLGLHYARTKQWDRAAPLLEETLAEAPERLPALEALASIREGQGRILEAIGLRHRINRLRAATPEELLALGEMAMSAQQTPLAIESFEKARAQQGAAFRNDLELGVLYLAARRLEEARAALERVAPWHPSYPMALFKRAQVSVLLREPDQASRVALARRHADATTRGLIASDRLFQSVRRP